MAIKLAATGVAEFAEASATKKRSLLRPYKLKKSGEAKGRSNYYQIAINAIKSFHKSENEKGVIADAIEALTLKRKSATHLDRIKCDHNIRVLKSYLAHFGSRKLKPIPGKRLFCKVKNLTITTQPELTAEENGKPLIVKLHFSSKKATTLRISILLHLMRQSAVNVGLHVNPENVACFDMDGTVHHCPRNTTAMDRIVEGLAGEIEDVWNAL